MEKIKAFFANKITKVVELVVLALVSAGLIIGGVETEAVSKVPGVVGGIITAIAALAAFISGLVKKEEK